MEFKDPQQRDPERKYTRINRIRLEFKEDHTLLGCYWWGVLIESDWNLKLHGKAAFCETGTVLIESDWNLKGLI